MKSYRSILVIKMSSLGDIIHALPTIYALRKNQPSAHIVWAVHPQFASILPGKPWIDEVILIDKKKLKSLSYLRQLRKQLHSYHFDMCLDLQCILKSAIVSAMSGANEKYGYWELREGSWLVNKKLQGTHAQDHVIERYLDTIRELGGEVTSCEFPLAVDATAEEAVQQRLHAEHCPASYVVVAPGARWSVKEWSPQKYASFIQRLVGDHEHVVLIGTAEDEQKALTIVNTVQSDQVHNWVGKTTLPELVSLIRHAALFVSADTGPLHIANALKVPLIALFGTTTPLRTGPYGGNHIQLVISPTSQATLEHPLVDDPSCMDQITVDRVWEAYLSYKEKGVR